MRFEGYDPSTVVVEETDAGLREIYTASGEIVGLEFLARKQGVAG